MNKFRSAFSWFQLFFAFVVFIAVLILGFIYQDTLRETVLVSILYVFWLGDLAIESFDQHCIWLLTLVITLVLTLKFSHRRAEKSIAPPKTTLRRPSQVIRRIHFWKNRIKDGRTAVFKHDYHRSDLLWLVVKTLAHRENSNPEDIKKRLLSGELLVPPEVQGILGMDDPQSSLDQQIGIIQRIQQIIHWSSERVQAPIFLPDPRLEEVATYLESLLEDGHDA